MGNVLQSTSSDTPEKPNVVDFEKKKDPTIMSQNAVDFENEPNINLENRSPNTIPRSESDRPVRPVHQLNRVSNDSPRTNFRPKSETLRPTYEMTRGGDGLTHSKSEIAKLRNKTSSGIIVDETKRPLRISEDQLNRRISRKDMQLLMNIQARDEKEKEQEREVVAYFGKEKRARVKSELRVRFEDEVREHFKSSSRHLSLDNRLVDQGSHLGTGLPTCETRREMNDAGSSRPQRPLSDIPVRSRDRQMFQLDKDFCRHMCRSDSYQDTTLGLSLQSISRMSRSMGQVALKEDLVHKQPTTEDVLGECYTIGKARLRLSNAVGGAQCLSRMPIDELDEPDREHSSTEENNRQQLPNCSTDNSSSPSDSSSAAEKNATRC